MSQTTPPPVDPLPPAPSTASPLSFEALADAFLAAILIFRTQLVALGLNMYNNAVDAYNSAVAAVSAATTATAAAAAAISAAGATLWVSGTTYPVPSHVISPADGRTYSRRVAGAGTLDPSADPANWAMVSNGPLPYMHVREEQASGTAGGTSTAASFAQTRALNTVKANTMAATLAANVLTLAVGTYQCRIRVPAYQVGGSKAALYNTSDATYTLLGSTVCSGTSSGTSTDSIIVGQFTIMASKNFTVRHYTASAYSSGLGSPAGAGQAEIYTEAEFWKVA